MKELRRYSLSTACLLVVWSAPALGARMMLLPAGVDPAGVVSWPYTHDAEPGDVIAIDVWAEATTPDAVALFQVQMPCVAADGDAGCVEFTSRTLDEARADYIYFGLTTLGLGGNNGTCPGACVPPGDPCTQAPVSGSLVLIQGTEPVVTTAKYVTTWEYTVSADAEGLFTLEPIAWEQPPVDCGGAALTFLVTPLAAPISFTMESLLIDVAGSCVLYDMNDDGFVSIVGDVPPFVDCLFFGNCACPQAGCVCPADCNCDGFLSIVGDVPCFVDCVFFGSCAACGGRGDSGGGGDGFTVGGAVYADEFNPLLSGVEGIRVNVTRAAGRIVATTTTAGPTGLWRVDNLPPGRYTVAFGHGKRKGPPRQDIVDIVVSARSEAANQSILLLRTSDASEHEAMTHGPSEGKIERKAVR